MSRWARGQALAAALSAQVAVDPDEIFQLQQRPAPSARSSPSQVGIAGSAHACLSPTAVYNHSLPGALYRATWVSCVV